MSRISEELKEELLECETLNEMLDLLNEDFNLDKPLTTMTKKIIIKALPNILTIANIKPR